VPLLLPGAGAWTGTGAGRGAGATSGVPGEGAEAGAGEREANGWKSLFKARPRTADSASASVWGAWYAAGSPRPWASPSPSPSSRPWYTTKPPLQPVVHQQAASQPVVAHRQAAAASAAGPRQPRDTGG